MQSAGTGKPHTLGKRQHRRPGTSRCVLNDVHENRHTAALEIVLPDLFAGHSWSEKHHIHIGSRLDQAKTKRVSVGHYKGASSAKRGLDQALVYLPMSLIRNQEQKYFRAFAYLFDGHRLKPVRYNGRHIFITPIADPNFDA